MVNPEVVGLDGYGRSLPTENILFLSICGSIALVGYSSKVASYSSLQHLSLLQPFISLVE